MHDLYEILDTQSQIRSEIQSPESSPVPCICLVQLFCHARGRASFSESDFSPLVKKEKMQSHQDAEVLAGLQIMTMGAMHAFKRKKSKHEGGKSDGRR